jgi:hypothetical protein
MTYTIPVTVAVARFERRAKMSTEWLREAITSLEHAAADPRYAHFAQAFVAKAEAMQAQINERAEG